MNGWFEPPFHEHTATRMFSEVKRIIVYFFLQLGLAEAARALNELNELTSNPAAVGSEQLNNYTAIIEKLYVYTLQERDVSFLWLCIL